MLCAVLGVQEFWQDTACLSWKLLRGWARLALWDRTWRWWSREFTPSLCLTAPSLSPEFSPGLPQLLLLLLLLQKKAKPGTVGLADNERPSEVFGLLLEAKTDWQNKSYFICCACFSPTTWITLFLTIACWSPWSEALHARPWWHNVFLSGRAIVHSAAGPTKCSHSLQPYGIVWQRTQTFLIESSRSVSDSGQFSGKTTWCFQNVVHQQARVELVPTRTLLGGTDLHQLLLP